MSSPSPSVELHDAVVLIGGFPLLSGVDLELDAGTLTVVTGANGAGKTSLLRLLGGLVSLSSGTGVVSGVDLRTGDLRELRRRTGWLGHEGAFYDDLSATENLTYAAKALERPIGEIGNILERVGLSATLEHTGQAVERGPATTARPRVAAASSARDVVAR